MNCGSTNGTCVFVRTSFDTMNLSATRVTIKNTSGDLIGSKNKYRFDFYGFENDTRIVVEL